ncbi:fumarylacetoacetate hydrolase family protein [Neobacillus sp. SuZ13]|uniref:2-keto-4-pentenoate hydratase n=1 Tax=Neobacillus sp. SuZ13 TaxID=3047875 RepID=UPI0024C08B4C|nr:fumarylacetoacetate hydrolase family protein [Neobacillus sp. SuZ13]WHY69643.1 fumarylacetoacetate hydrolase family protein [Neobacillus sp. SuZ13]
MIKTDVIDQIAFELYNAEKQKKSVNKFVDVYPELDEGLAYQVQERLIEMKCREEQTKRVGRKLGLTSKAKQVMMGVHEPSYGVLLESMQLFEGERVSLSPFIHAKVEPEIAFIFNKELKGPHVTVADVLAATEYIAPALEIIDSRFQGFSFTLQDAVADNSSSSRYIIGERFYSPENFDLKLMGIVFKQNGEVVATGAGAAVMGHPARAIAWLANKLYKVGQSIQSGEVVLSGSLTSAVKIEAGDHFSASFDGLGSVEAVFTE